MMQISTDAATANDGKGREFTDAEKDELAVLTREVDNMNIQIKATQADLPEVKVLNREIEIEKRIREAVTKGKQMQFDLMREVVQDMSTVQDSLVPLTINDVVPPLEKGLIYDKVGLKVQTGLAGDYVWPLMGSVVAEVAGEKVALSDQSIDFTNIKPEPRRVGISIPVTMQTVTQTRGVILDLIRQQMPIAISRTLNHVLFSHEKFTGKLYGPFKDAEEVDAFAGAVPTYKELLAMKGKVMGAGITGGTFCYVMSEAMKATLEATPRDAGSGLMICENDRIAGYPVFCTEYINYGAATQVDSVDKYSGKDASKASEEYIGAGVWLYQVLGQFGDFRFTVDPYTNSKSDEVVFTLNSDWSSTTLRKEAFVLKKTTPGA